MSNSSEPWRGPSSIFLISRSSCAFVNFSSQADLDRAVPFFHGLSLRPWDPRCPRMVCRVRHKDDDLRAGVGAQRGVGMHRAWVDQHRQAERADKQNMSPKAAPTLELPDNPHSQSSSSNHRSSASFASTNSSFLIHHFPKRYFILKSLTIVSVACGNRIFLTSRPTWKMRSRPAYGRPNGTTSPFLVGTAWYWLAHN